MGWGDREARERVEAVFEAADRLPPDFAASVSLPSRDLDRRAELLEVLEHEARRHDRAELLEDARGRLNDALSTRSMSGAYTQGRGGTIIRHASGEDQAAILLALMDAVAVAVAEDLVPPADAAELSAPGRQLLGLPPVGASADPGASVPAGAPSEAEWAAAAEGGAAAVDHDEPYGDGTGLRRTFFLVTGGVLAVIALAAGVAIGQGLFGLLAAGAVGALAWTFATWKTSPDRP